MSGSPTLTHALLPGSPALDKGSPAAVGSGGNACETTDQRGLGRPADGDGNGSQVCDIGAYEVGAFPVTLITYTYDPLYRLTAANYSTGPFFRYIYDAVGNRLTQTTLTSTITYTYDIANRLVNVGGVAYTWDNNGNLLSDGVSTYVYDSANRPITITQGSTIYTFGYNGLGDRQKATTCSGVCAPIVTRYVLDLNAGLTQVLVEDVIEGTPTTYLYGNGRIAQQSIAGTSYFLPDALGSVRQLTNSSAQVTLARSYDPFGNPLTSVGSGTTNYNFAGEWRDATGLIHLRARYYGSQWGRFISADTWGGDYRQPLTLNKWLYVNGNPINYTDPSGQFIDTLLDLAFLFYDLQVIDTYIARDCDIPTEAWLALGLDAVGLLLPFVTGGGAIVHAATRLDDVSDLARFASRVDDVGDAARVVNTAGNLAQTVNQAGNVVQATNQAGNVVQVSNQAGNVTNVVGAFCSFSADTLVATEAGGRAISDLRIGDLVLAYNEILGTTGFYTITAVLAHRDPIIVHLAIDGERITITPEHPFFTLERGWIAAGNLWIGAHIRRADGGYGLVQEIEIGHRPQMMYNLTVAQAHTFFVGQNEWLVHNTCRPNVIDQGYNYRALWPGDPAAVIFFKEEGQGVVVEYINRGNQPRGSGGHMLANALNRIGITQPRFLKGEHIIHADTLRDLEAGKHISETRLGHTFSNAVRELGGTITGWDLWMDRANHLNYIVHISY